MKYWEILTSSGPVMWIIVGVFALAMILFLTKVMQFHRDEINIPELLKGLRNTLQRNAFVEALSLCDNTPGPTAKLLGAAILAHQNGDDLRMAMDEVAIAEIPRLERFIRFIGSLGFILPLLGFLGTVYSMTDAFETASRMSSGLPVAMKNAINNTAAGLTFAVICYLAHNYLAARLDAILLDMEKASMEIISFFDRRSPAEQGK